MVPAQAMNLPAAIPYFTIGPWALGPLKIHSFGIMVAIGVMLAHEIALWRTVALSHHHPKLVRAHMNTLLGYLLLIGFVGSHVFDLIMYQPQALLKNPLLLIDFRTSLSSYGGIMGALIGLFIYSRKYPKRPLLPYLDAAAFSLPVGWFFGRLGCALVHDHPGAPTSFFLAVDFGNHGPGGIRHDLGLYEAIWWIVIIGLFFAIDRAKPHLRAQRGFFLGLLPVVYAPVRFSLDFLRVLPAEGGDARYFGLTPAQYISMTVFVVGLVLLKRVFGKAPAS